MAMNNYVPVMQRLSKFRADNSAKKISIKTSPIHVDLEKEVAYFQCSIYLDGECVAQETSMAPALGDSKEYEKAATSALGRALALLGYEASDESDTDSDEEDTEEKPRKGLGAKKKSAKKSKKEEAEEETDDDDEESEEDSEDESDEEDDDDSDEEAEEKSDKKEEKKSEAKPASTSALKDVMNKYGLGKKKE